MRLTSSLVLLALAFRDVACTAADKSPLEAEDERRGTRLSDFVDNFMDMPDIKPLFRQEDGQCEFTKRLRDRALLQYPGFNVVVYSNLKATDNELVNTVCSPVDVQHAVWPQQMYKLCVFQSGRFTRVGDKKCENWQCGGCAVELYGSTVQFCRVQPTTALSRTTTSRPTSKPPGTTIKYGAGSRSSTSSTSKGQSKTSNKATTKTPTTSTSSRPRGKTTTQRPTTSSQPVPGTTATDTSTTTPPSPTTTTPPVLPHTSAAGGSNTGARTTDVPRAAGSTNEPAVVGVLAAVGMAFMAMA
ncbi:hypothetical protein MAPG_04156 [Magnaporthiopsis poae ATCC 64411]|uniref:Secreted protein n=1 Tax=Magnaporthiopsis poae (strain ATCC 64411 / 73-15) TaxID=644358 RepID=A0A0C4DVY8_MAGP6|nr:hypothetical protein MAPG_04156 [Magnaporthiopsis poae ATCC 64411]